MCSCFGCCLPLHQHKSVILRQAVRGGNAAAQDCEMTKQKRYPIIQDKLKNTKWHSTTARLIIY